MLFLDKKKIEGDTYNAQLLSLKQVRKAHPNISIPELTLREMDKLEKVANELDYEIVPAPKQEDLLDLIGDSFKEKKMTVTSCKRESGKWVRNFQAEKIHGDDLARYRGQLRTKRNELLAQSDWTQTSDSPLTDGQKAEWKTYRQALRDLPKNYDHPIWCKYPTSPKGGE